MRSEPSPRYSPECVEKLYEKYLGWCLEGTFCFYIARFGVTALIYGVFAEETKNTFLILQCHLYETTHRILHAARLSRSQ